MKKTYVLDTNVLLSDPLAIYAFEDNNVVIPSVVLEELDSKKKLPDELGRNARHVARELDALREIGKLHNGVLLRNGGNLVVKTHDSKSPIFERFLDDKNDNAIIAVAFELKETSLDTQVVLISKDVLVRVKADTVSVNSEDYLNDKVATSEDELYKGYSTVSVPDEMVNRFYRNKSLRDKMFDSYPENHFFILKSEINDSKSAVCRKLKGKLVPLYQYSTENPIFGTIKHKNVEQMMALDLLLDDNVPIVTLSGKAGTGKTLLALAVSLQKTLDEQTYRKVLVGRPVVPMGKDIGYLPGEKDEKLRPWMQPIYDNLEYLFDCKDEDQLNKLLQGYEDIIKVEALTYIRGRSIPNQWIIIDEAQNLSRHEVKTIATRLGEGSKLVLLGDPFQIDSPYLDIYSNGLTHFTEAMKEQKEVGHITFTKGERSTISQLCADML
ncbi:PhoH family protein [Paenibacillus sp. XY044]|uniref:PhoH family protein n=1 Tax=Paenibacillus sp. XY044 TaxID=2026089 RepID=UPI000B99252F|nr:PhoH family protein [Paenibacillus sp. XY044]OZB98036.1 hypothetical protein CJP46_02395 [Paenibacillus sp. XY044]